MARLQVTNWTNNVTAVEPMFGDLLEFDRGVYRHWGLCVGNRQIIHFKPADSEEKIRTLRKSDVVPGLVDIDPITKVIGSSNFRINNKDYGHKAKSVDAIRKIINSCLINPKLMNYCLVHFNCEHFVRFLKFGVHFSSQVEPVAGTLLIVGSALLQNSLIPSEVDTQGNFMLDTALNVQAHERKALEVIPNLEKLAKAARFL